MLFQPPLCHSGLSDLSGRYHRWKAGPSPPRQRHWFKALRKQLLIHRGLNLIDDLTSGFDGLWGQGIIPVSRTT